MFSKALVGLAVLALAREAAGANIHRHAHRELEKKDVVTNIAYVTDVVTQTVWIGGEPTSKSKQFYTASRHRHSSKVSVASVAPTSTSTTSTSTLPTSTSTSTPEPEPTTSTTSPAVEVQAVAPATTLVTSTKPAETTAEPAPAVSVEAAVPQVAAVSTAAAAAAVAAATTAASSSTSTDSSKKRGLAYNDKNLLSGFLGSDSKVSWKYNWGQADDGGSTGVEFVPMLWGTGSNHEPTWAANAEKAIAAGSKNLLSFNEPDNAGQSNMSPADAAAAHIRLVVPYAGRIRIGSPAITNSNSAGEGIDWLTSFVSACAGNCKLDFVAIHWYNAPDTDEFLQHLVKVHEAVNLPIWITEFAPTGDADTINSFLQTVMKEMDSNPTYSFVERYSYFMVGANSLISSGTTLSSFGNTFAYA